MPVTLIGWMHFLLALAAMAAGGLVAMERKGTPRHRRLGRTYGFLMLGVNGTAFMLYGLLGHFGPFHVAALFSLVTIVAGWLPARRRSSGWVAAHAYMMCGSYVGLLAAAAAETLGRIPNTPFWGMVIAASLAVSIIGALILRRRLPATLAPYTRAAPVGASGRRGDYA